jgi:hypothetical protein
VSADGKTLTIDIVSRDNAATVIGNIVIDGRGIVLDADNNAVSGFSDLLTLNRISGTGTEKLITLEQKDLLNGVLEWIDLSTQYHELAYRAYQAGWRTWEDRLGVPGL